LYYHFLTLIVGDSENKTKQENLLVSSCSALAFSSFRYSSAGSIGQKSAEIFDIKKLKTPMKDLFSNIAHIRKRIYYP
jgi:hypothetical protein